MAVQKLLTESQRQKLVEFFEQAVDHKTVARELGIYETRVAKLHRYYLTNGTLDFMAHPQVNSPRYSYETKKQVVDRVLAGESRASLAREFGIGSVRSINRWIEAFREGGDEALQPQGRKAQPVQDGSELADVPEGTPGEVEILRAQVAILKKLRDLGL